MAAQPETCDQEHRMFNATPTPPPVTDDMAETLKPLVQVLVPEQCFDEFFVKYNVFDPKCLTMTISKCLGFSIILGSVMVKVPQILKILRNKSGEGISILSQTLELAAITSTLAYNFAQGYPFSAWGEAMFLVIQTVLIAFFVHTYNGSSLYGTVYTAFYVVILAFLMSPSAPRDLLWILQAAVIPITVSARMIQAYQNWRNGSTGQLSAITLFLLFVGALARVFTSIMETGDPIIIMTYAVSSGCNAILAFQMIYYWNVTKDTKTE